MPPLTPQSTYPIFFSASSLAFSKSSVKRELPPSMTRSPGSSRSASLATVSRVGSPAGTMTHTTRGAARALTRAGRVRTSATSGLRSKPTTSWPARRNRSRMLPPILPRPMRPSCMSRAFLQGAWGDRVRRYEATPYPAAPPIRPSGPGLACRTDRACVLGWWVGAGSAGEADGHEDVAVAGVRLGVGLGLAGEDRGTARLREGQPAPGGADRVEAVEQELRVEGDLDLGTVESRLDRLGGLRVVAGAGLDGDLAVAELQQHRGVALCDERHALDGLLERRRLDDRLGVDRGREDRGHLGVLPVEEAGGRAATARLEADEPVTALAEGEL